MAVFTQTLTQSAGAVTATFDDTIHGFVTSIMVNKNGQTNNPTVDIDEVGGLQRKILDVTVTATGNQHYPVREEVEDTTGGVLGAYAFFFVDTPLQATVASGDTSGTITFTVQYIPV